MCSSDLGAILWLWYGVTGRWLHWKLVFVLVLVGYHLLCWQMTLKMQKGALEAKWTDRTNPMDQHVNVMSEQQGFGQAPPTAQMFGGAGREHRWKYGTKRETFGKVSVKARQHASRNPFALFSDVLSLEEVMAAPEVFDPLTRYQCCPPTCGAAAAIVCSDDFARRKGITNPVYIAAQAMATDFDSSFQDSMIKMVGYDMTRAAAQIGRAHV